MKQGNRRKAGSFVPEVVTKSLVESMLLKPPVRQVKREVYKNQLIYAAAGSRFIFNRASRWMLIPAIIVKNE